MTSKQLLFALGAVYIISGGVFELPPLAGCLLWPGAGFFVSGTVVGLPVKDAFQISPLGSQMYSVPQMDATFAPPSSRRQIASSHSYNPEAIRKAPLRGIGTPVLQDVVNTAAAAYATLVSGASDGNMSFNTQAGITKYPKLYDVSLGLDYAIDTAEPDDAVYDTNNASSLNFTRSDNGTIASYPIAAYAIVPCYNIPQLNSSSDPPLKLAKETLANIYFGAIRYWDDPQILATNPDLAAKLPHARITLVIRGDPFTMNKQILQALSTFNSTFATRVPPSITPDWCEGANMTRLSGDPKRELLVRCTKRTGDILRMYLPLSLPLMLTRIKAQPYTLGLVSSQHAMNLRAAMLSNDAHEFVMPSTTSVVFAAMDKGTLLDSHWRASLLSPMSPQAWPISSYIYLVVRAKSHISACESRQRMLLFWSWFVSGTESQQLLTSLGLAPLPRFLQKLVVSQMNEDIKCVADCVSVCTCATRPSACIYPFPDAQTIPVTMQGADSVADVMRLIFQIYTAQPELANMFLDYQPKDSLSAFENLLNQSNTLDMAITMFDSGEMKAFVGPVANELVTLPFVTIATVPVYHCSELDGQSLVLTPTLLAEIYLGNVTKWNDPLIVAANPDLASLLPNTTISIITRSDESFTTEMFTRYLSSQHDDFKAKIGIVRSLNPSWLGANNQTVIVADSDEAVEGLLLESDHSLGFGKLSPNVDIAQLSINVSDPTGQSQRAVSIAPNSNNILSCAHDPANIEQVGRYSWVINPVKSTLLNEAGGADFVRADSSLQRTIGEADPASDTIETVCYPITGTFGIIMHLHDSSSSLSQTSDSYNDDALSTSSSVAAATQEVTCGNRRSTLDFLNWLYSTGNGLGSAMYPFGAAFPSTQVQQLARAALLQVRCDGKSYLATPRQCIYSQDMTFNVSSTCSGPTDGREIQFSWTKGDERLCYGGDALPKNTEISCEYVGIHSGPGVAVSVLSALGVIFCTFFLMWTYRHRNAKIVTFSQRSFLFAFILSAGCLNQVSLLFLGENSDALCLARPWLFNIFSTLTYTILYMKLRRVYILFSAGALKKVKISNTQVAAQIVLTMGVDILILIIWTAISRPRSVTITLEVQGVGSVNVTECGSPFQATFVNIMRIWKGILLLYGGYLSKLSWDIDSKFSEAKHIAVSIYNSMMVAAVVVVMNFLPVPAKVLVLCQALACAVAANGSVGMVMIPKLYLINHNPSAVTMSKDSTKVVALPPPSPTGASSSGRPSTTSVAPFSGPAAPPFGGPAASQPKTLATINEKKEALLKSLRHLQLPLPGQRHSDACLPPASTVQSSPATSTAADTHRSASSDLSSADIKVENHRNNSVSSTRVAPVETDHLISTLPRGSK